MRTHEPLCDCNATDLPVQSLIASILHSGSRANGYMRLCWMGNDDVGDDHSSMISKTTIKKAMRFARAISKYAADSFRNVTPSELAQRLATCNQCDQFKAGECTACGCNLKLKARMRSSVCPLEKWPV